MDANVMIWKWPSWGKLIRLLTEENHSWMKLAQKVVLQLIINLSNWMRGNLPNNIHNPIPGFFFYLSIFFPMKGTTSLPRQHYSTFFFLWAPFLYQANIIAWLYLSNGTVQLHITQLRSETTKQTPCTLFAEDILLPNSQHQTSLHHEGITVWLEVRACPLLIGKVIFITWGLPPGNITIPGWGDDRWVAWMPGAVSDDWAMPWEPLNGLPAYLHEH